MQRVITLLQAKSAFYFLITFILGRTYLSGNLAGFIYSTADSTSSR
jgi:hypothetical protein